MKKRFTYLFVSVCLIVGTLLSQEFLKETLEIALVQEVILIDKSLGNYEDLVTASTGKGRLILVENSNGGFEALLEELRALRGVKNLHVLAHGSSGNLVLGGKQLNESNFGTHKAFWEALRNSFASEQSQLFVYSCQLADGKTGQSFVNKLHEFLGVSVASSEDNTGAERKGGNWVLEYSVGDIVEENGLALLEFGGLLIPYYTERSGANSPFDALTIDADNQIIYGDFDADGDIDIHLYPGSDLDNEFWQNNGSGTFSKVAGNASPFRHMQYFAAFYNAKNAHVADWDNDGDDDIFVTLRASGENNIFYKNNNGVYTAVTGVNSPFAGITISGNDQFIYGDFDGDGDIDISAYPGGGVDALNDFWQNNGSGQFTKVTGAQNPFRNIAFNAPFYNNAKYAHVADWDNDGDVDIFVTNYNASGQNTLFRNDNGTFLQLSGADSPFKNITIAQDNQFIYGDFDGDGDLDIQASSSNSETTLKFWRNNGSGAFTEVSGAGNPFNNLPNRGAFYNSAAYAFVADWNNDGDDDILVTNRTATHQNILFEQNGTPPVLSTFVPATWAYNVPVDGAIVLTFNRTVTAAPGKNILIKNASNDVTLATIPVTSSQVTGSGTPTITLKPTADLPGFASVYLVIDKGAFRDADSRIFAGVSEKTLIRFSTGASPVVPSVTTTLAKDFSANSCVLGGEVTSDGRKPVTERGVVWGTSRSPTVDDNKVVMGAGTGVFSETVTSLPAATLLFARAYAINSVGVAYGDNSAFFTQTSVTSIAKASASPSNASSVSYTVKFAHDVAYLDPSDFSLTTSGVEGASILSVSGVGKTYTVEIGTGSGNGTIRLDFTAPTGIEPSVPSSFTSAEAYTMYKVSGSTDWYRQKSGSTVWNQAGSWESSNDSQLWINATNFPNSSGASVATIAGQTLNLPTDQDISVGDLNNAGSLRIHGGTLSVSGTFVNSGTIDGSGTVANGNFINAGILAPGASPGTLSFAGNLSSEGQVDLELGGTAPGIDYDQILTSGTLTFAGTLNVTLIDEFAPRPGDTFILFDGASSSGAFSTLNLPSISPYLWETNYDHAEGTFTLRAVIDPLPVSLFDFHVEKRENAAKLSWTTVRETNSSHFQIERSSTATGWEVVGTVLAQTESRQRQNYTFTDARPLSRTNFYRLKMVDLDASYAYSPIRSLVVEEGPLEVRVYPNPVADRLFVDQNVAESISQIQLYDVLGHLKYESNRYHTEGVVVSDFQPGVYVLRIKKSDGSFESFKFLKK
jgi:hypothetical protein